MELSLELDKKADDSINDLMRHYNVKSRADLISKAISVLKVVAYVEDSQGDLIARRNGHETKINFN